jgi:N-acyl-D-aspartate/D-glutamate deacylase
MTSWIRGANVVYGLGHDAIRADVAVRNGRIAGVGEISKDAPEIVNAGGLALMPGIIDLRTHFDAQVTWEQVRRSGKERETVPILR